MTSSRPALPGRLRLALLVLVAVGALVSFGAARDVSVVLTLNSPVPVEGSEASLPGLGLSPQAQRAVWLATASGLRGAIASMTTSRVVIAMLLSSAASLVFVLALRLRWTTIGVRAPLAVLLGRVSIGAAVLRTLDGAQQLVIARTTAQEFAKALQREAAPEAQTMSELSVGAFSAVSIGWTMAVVALLVGLGRYVSSDAARDAFARAEAS
jgi:hypothetical protein